MWSRQNVKSPVITSLFTSSYFPFLKLPFPAVIQPKMFFWPQGVGGEVFIAQSWSEIEKNLPPCQSCVSGPSMKEEVWSSWDVFIIYLSTDIPFSESAADKHMKMFTHPDVYGLRASLGFDSSRLVPVSAICLIWTETWFCLFVGFSFEQTLWLSQLVCFRVTHAQKNTEMETVQWHKWQKNR